MTDPVSFPSSFVDLLIDRYTVLVPGHQVVGRPLRTSDPHQTIGVFAGDWQPEQGSMEQAGSLAGEPTLGRYNVVVQNVVKSADESMGRRLASVNGKIMRGVLYRDTTLKVSFHQLTETLLGRTERPKRFGVSRQRYVNDRISSGWIYLTTTEIWFETESV